MAEIFKCPRCRIVLCVREDGEIPRYTVRKRKRTVSITDPAELTVTCENCGIVKVIKKYEKDE